MSVAEGLVWLSAGILVGIVGKALVDAVVARQTAHLTDLQFTPSEYAIKLAELARRHKVLAATATATARLVTQAKQAAERDASEAQAVYSELLDMLHKPPKL